MLRTAVSPSSVRTYDLNYRSFSEISLIRLIFTKTQICSQAHCSDKLTSDSHRDFTKQNRGLIFPVTGTRSPRFAYRQSLWLADMWHAYYRLWAPSAIGVIYQNGVGVQAISNLAIGFPLVGTISLVKD